MPDLPTLAEAVSSRAALEQALCILLEPSTSLREHLVPALSTGLDNSSGGGSAQSQPTTYADVVDAAEAEVATWSQADKADFLGGHPRIGEVKNLSALSSKEQSGATQTPPEVLAKLEVRLETRVLPIQGKAAYVKAVLHCTLIRALSHLFRRP